MDSHTTQLQAWIDLANAGDANAREQLIAAAGQRLRQLAHAMLSGDRVRRWEETDDVLQRALIGLHLDLAELRPTSARDFLRLAAFRIRRVLIDLARHYYGPQGLGANHESVGLDDTDSTAGGLDTPDSGPSPSQISGQRERWQKLHAAIDRLTAEEQELVDLLWLHELKRDEAALLLGISPRTLQRRWQRVRLRLCEILGGRSDMV